MVTESLLLTRRTQVTRQCTEVLGHLPLPASLHLPGLRQKPVDHLLESMTVQHAGYYVWTGAKIFPDQNNLLASRRLTGPILVFCWTSGPA